MRVLVISHTYIAPINRKKWQSLSFLFPEVDLRIIFPNYWPTTIFKHKAEDDLSAYNSDSCTFLSLDTFKAGNEVLYCYTPIKLFSIIKNFKPDIIHVEQGDNALSYFQAILFTKILGINSKFIFFTWVNWHHKFSLKYRFFWKWIEKFNLKKSDAAIVGNADALAILHGKKFFRPTIILPQLGVDLQIFRPVKKECSSSIKIGFAGRLVEEKGIFLLLRAFAELSNKYKNLKLSYLGSGPSKTQLLQRIIDLNVKDNVEIIAPVPHEQVAIFMQSLDIFILPSFDLTQWREQFGHVLIEAMACKVAVVGSDAAEIPNIIACVGQIFKQKNYLSLRDAIEKLIIDESYRNNLAELGYQKVIKNYSCAAIAEQTYKFWSSVLKKENCCE
ncbi:MAG: Glycosyl transferase, group 1 [candidate division TM6 bacterium GW2011_GWF2_37_49]|nr:MAG: Glycosyl transferase, group 1 [candidate division TM6 bacterium GW2011_GWF2_37_49]